MNLKTYPIDITEDRQKIIVALLLPHRSGGRPPKWELPEIPNAVLYIVRAGCAWRLLPHDFPPWQTVYYYFRRWKKDGIRRKNSVPGNGRKPQILTDTPGLIITVTPYADLRRVA